MNRRQQIDELHKELKSSPERKLIHCLNVFEIPRYFFQKSYEDFVKEANEILKTPEYEIKRFYSEPKYFMEFTRLFYNYCTTSSLLIDTTRVLISDLKEHNVILDKKKLDHAKKTRFENLTCKSIKIFRNLFSHVQSPLFAITYYPQQNKAYIQFRKDNPLILNEKDTDARKLFDSTDEPIDICQLAKDYYKIIINFHNWLNDEVTAHIKERISDYEQKRQMWITLTNAELIEDFCRNKGKSGFDIGKRIIESYDASIQNTYKQLVAERKINKQIDFLIGILLSYKVIKLTIVDEFRQLLIRFYN